MPDLLQVENLLHEFLELLIIQIWEVYENIHHLTELPRQFLADQRDRIEIG